MKAHWHAPSLRGVGLMSWTRTDAMTTTVFPVASPPPPVASKLRRWRPVWLTVLSAAVILLLCLGASSYLGSEHFRRAVAAEIQNHVGGRVEIGRIEVGSPRSNLHDLKLFEEGQEEPWLRIGSLDTDVTLIDLLGSSPPKEIEARQVQVRLRFDADKHLLTKLPKAKEGGYPNVRILDGTLIIAQEGRPPFRISCVQGDAVAAGGLLKFTGTIDDPIWGEWTASGEYDVAKASSSLTLKSADATTVRQSMLESLPFVSPGVWKHVRCDGRTTAEISFRKASADPTPHYRLALDPRDVRVRISSIDLQAESAGGHVLIEDKLVTLADVNGSTANGRIHLNGTLDFRSPIYDHHFEVTASGLDVRQLPDKWKIPPRIHGLLSGDANLFVKFADGKAITSGSGEGVVAQFRIGLVPILIPVRLKLLADERGFHFMPVLPLP
jgi:hypothetical protein